MEAIATIEFQTKGKGDARSVALREEVVKERKRRRKILIQMFSLAINQIIFKKKEKKYL